MELQIASLELSQLSKQVEFNWETHYSYAEDNTKQIDFHSAIDLMGEDKFTIEDIKASEDNGYKAYFAPEIDLLSKWLRDIHNINTYVVYKKDEPINKWELHLQTEFEVEYVPNEIYETYEKALEEGLLQALLYLKEKQKYGTTDS